MQHRIASALSAALVLALAGCGGSDPAAVSGDAVRTAASTTAAPVAAAATDADYTATVQQIYIAYFGRPADIPGRKYWSHILWERGAPTDLPGVIQSFWNDGKSRPIIDAFAVSQEWLNLHVGRTDAQFVDILYVNLFNRHADLAGLSYWSGALSRGQMTRQVAALMLMTGAQGDDALSVQKKVAVALRFDELLGARFNGSEAYTGENWNAQARMLIAEVDARTDLAAFDAKIKALVDGIAPWITT